MPNTDIKTQAKSLCVLVFMLKILARLPWRLQYHVGAFIGLILFYAAKKRRHIAIKNLRLAYPSLDPKNAHALAKKVFKNQGIGIFETARAWLGTPPPALMIGFDDKVLFDDTPCVILGAHFTLLDLMGRLLATRIVISTMYRPQNRPWLDALITSCRAPIYQRQISSKDIKAMLSAIKKGQNIWYACDQDYGKKHAVFVPFFAQMATTITAHRDFYKFSKQRARFYFLHAYRDKGVYILNLMPINPPTDDPVADAAYINRVIATSIHIKPAQYMWFHKRYKNQPDDTNFYV